MNRSLAGALVLLLVACEKRREPTAVRDTFDAATPVATPITTPSTIAVATHRSRGDDPQRDAEGAGFAAAARTCLLAGSFSPAKNDSGDPVPAAVTMKVRFVR